MGGESGHRRNNQGQSFMCSAGRQLLGEAVNEWGVYDPIFST